MAAVALSLAASIGIGVAGRAVALGASRGTLGGIVGLGVAGAGDMVASSNAADVFGIAWNGC